MAGVKAPLMSIDASGSVAGAIVFSKWKGRNYVRQSVTPHNPKSGLQKGARAALTWSTQQYKNIGATAQANWLVIGKKTNVSAINAMVHLNGQRARQDKSPYKDPNITSATAEAAPTALAAAAGPKSATITWVDSAGAADWGTSLYVLDGGAVTTGPATLVAMVAHGVQKYLLSNLITGHVYHIKARGFSTDGTYSADTAEITVTPT